MSDPWKLLDAMRREADIADGVIAACREAKPRPGSLLHETLQNAIVVSRTLRSLLHEEGFDKEATP